MDATTHSPWLDALPAYALGALEGEELQALAAHLATGCPTCAAELAALQADCGLLAESAEPIEPPAGARERLLAAVAAPATALPRRPRWLPAAAAVAVLLLGASSWWGLRQQSRAAALEAERARLAGELSAAQARLALVEAERAEMVRQLSIVGGTDLRQVQLAGLEGAPGAAGRAFVDARSRRALFYASGLPALPADRSYQLWMIAGGTPVPAGVFTPGTRGEARLVVDRVPEVDTIDAWAVTVEPAGGLPAPSGPMVLRG